MVVKEHQMLSLCLFIVGLCKTPVDPIRVSEFPGFVSD